MTKAFRNRGMVTLKIYFPSSMCVQGSAAASINNKLIQWNNWHHGIKTRDNKNAGPKAHCCLEVYIPLGSYTSPIVPFHPMNYKFSRTLCSHNPSHSRGFDSWRKYRVSASGRPCQDMSSMPVGVTQKSRRSSRSLVQLWNNHEHIYSLSVQH